MASRLNALSRTVLCSGQIVSGVDRLFRNMSTRDFVRVICKMCSAEAAAAPSDTELDYWTKEIESGRYTKAGIISVMLVSARSFVNDPQYAWVTSLLDNKLRVGRFFAVQQGIIICRMPKLTSFDGHCSRDYVRAHQRCSGFDGTFQ